MKQIFSISFGIILIFLIILQFQFGPQIKAQQSTNALYKELPTDDFIKNWYILGPVKVKDIEKGKLDEVLKKTFEDDPFTTVENHNGLIDPVKINGKSYNWKIYNSPSDIIELHKFLGNEDNVICYALTEIISSEPQKLLIGLGSDDGVKVWVNGNEVHKNSIGRPITIDEDIFPVELNKGSNQILIKIQNQQFGYGFAFRSLGRNTISSLLIDKIQRGNFDEVKKLMLFAPDLTYKNAGGLTAWQLATIKGRTDIAEYLVQNGAEKLTQLPSLHEYIQNSLVSFSGKDSIPGVAVLISQNGQVIYKNGFGLANIGTHTAVATDTKFRIGSITKQFTAAAILRLQEQGKLNVNDKLSIYIPDFPKGENVSIHQLLTHSSGIHSYTNDPDFREKTVSPVTDAELLKIIKSGSYDFKPGEQFSYSNSGYVLLGMLVSQVSGKSYADFLNDEFFIPLGMKNSGVYSKSNMLSNEAIGYTYENGKLAESLDWDMSWAAGAGAIYSTVEDLFLWNEAIFNGKVLNDSSLKMAFTTLNLPGDHGMQKVPYGYGWMITELRGQKVISHGGGLDGFLSQLTRLPDEKLSIVVLINSTPAYSSIYPEPFANELAEYLLWEIMDKQISPTIDTSFSASDLAKFTGRYDYGGGMILTISQEDTRLIAQMSGQPALEIFYKGNNEFYWKQVEARIQFSFDEKNNVIGATHYQGGMEFKVKKIE